jgi:crotonobetainyl-CoA:carnitine CoA-transferase CaiB-like acyl-CoA transferase
MKKALEDIRVLDLSRVLAGPFCTQMLGDLGAEIIKIEKPKAGDDTRFWGPPFLKDKNGNDTNESAYYLSVNRNKKSVAIDIKTKEGQALIHKLLENCDVLIENFKVGGLEHYGLSYNDLKKKYPKLVYCAITGFGQDGPMADEPGYDLMAQAMAGLMAITGETNGAPMKVGVALSDIMTGFNAAIGILAALHAREKTGKGQLIDVALMDCTLASLTNVAQYFLTSGKPAGRFGNAHSTIVPYEAFETKDGHMVVAVGNNDQFRRFANLLGHAEWADDARFAKNTDRVKNRKILVPMIADILKTKPSAFWVDGLRKCDVPGGPVNTIDQVFAMDQTRHRDMQISMKHGATGQNIDLVGSPLKLSETPVNYRLSPPVLGEHTQEVLEKLPGITPDELQKLEKAGVIERANR